jgi:multiple sugar transport system ATP-binding protein
MQVADPLTLYHQPENVFVAGFIGSPPMNLFKGTIERRAGNLLFHETGEADALFVPLTGRLGKLAQPLEGKPVVFGIRPENISESPQPGESTPITANIELSEPMGSETNAYFKTGSGNLIARLHTERLLNMGDSLTLHLNLARAHLFDANTEQVIR